MANLLNADQAAAYLTVTKQTLSSWRLSGRGPDFVKLGRRIAYSQAALDAFLKARTFSSTSEYLLDLE